MSGVRRALLSVQTTWVVEFAKVLISLVFEIISSAVHESVAERRREIVQAFRLWFSGVDGTGG